ncbi:MAG: hypothetical protein OJF50_006617 [Nitrospira sp.]|nr:hypothetical protein [Nitrospira sp.]
MHILSLYYYGLWEGLSERVPTASDGVTTLTGFLQPVLLEPMDFFVF